MSKKKHLLLLDLDNTLIYGSYKELPKGELLFQHGKYLWVYARPGAREFVHGLSELGDIIVYTSAMRDYAKKVCRELEIPHKELFSRKHCKYQNGIYRKWIRKEWHEAYERIIVVDDDPAVYLDDIAYQVPIRKYMGEASDNSLLKLIPTLFFISNDE